MFPFLQVGIGRTCSLKPWRAAATQGGQSCAKWPRGLTQNKAASRAISPQKHKHHNPSGNLCSLFSPPAFLHAATHLLTGDESHEHIIAHSGSGHIWTRGIKLRISKFFPVLESRTKELDEVFDLICNPQEVGEKDDARQT